MVLPLFLIPIGMVVLGVVGFVAFFIIIMDPIKLIAVLVTIVALAFLYMASKSKNGLTLRR